MKISTRSRYGTMAMIEIARSYDKNSITRNDIIHKQSIPKEYLAHILLTLKGQRLITTMRGVNGGYRLAQSPSKISLFNIVGALEGSLTPVECVENADSCKKSSQCSARKAWVKLYEAQLGVLKGISLQDLLEMENENDGTLMYFI